VSRLASAALRTPRRPSALLLARSVLADSQCAAARGSAHHRLVLRAALCSKPSGAAAAAAPADSSGSKKKQLATVPPRWTAAWAWHVTKETALHYWHGSKLLAADIRVAWKLLGRVVAGRSLSRREHNLLVRVSADIARLVPLSFFILVPMMEFALPFALRLFPNLLPSTFEEKHQREEKRVKLLKVRLEMAQLLEHTLEKHAAQVTAAERAKLRKEEEELDVGGLSLDETREHELKLLARKQSVGGKMPEDVRRFMVQMREGGVPNASTDELLTMMRGFKDNVTLDHLYRDQLVAMARFLGMNAFAPTAILRFQIRQRLRKLRNEDKDIMWEGVDTVREDELLVDLRARGLPTLNLRPDQMRSTLHNWLQLSQKKEIPYTLLILTNMLHFASLREEQQQLTKTIADGATRDPEIDVAAAKAALSSLPSDLAVDSTLVSQVDVSNDDKLQALVREERLVDEEREVAESFVEAETLADDDELSDTPKKKPKAEKKKPKTEKKLQLSHDQVGEIAEAVELMAADSPVANQRLEVEELLCEREGRRERIEEAGKRSKTVAMLDGRVAAMIESLKTELEQTESTIGQAFHSLDLDGDGVLSREELVRAMGELHLSKRPDAAAFHELLDEIDVDDDGKISVKDFRRLVQKMQMRRDDSDDDVDVEVELGGGQARTKR